MADLLNRLLAVLLALAAAQGHEALAQWLTRRANIVMPRKLVSGAATSTLRTWLSGALDELGAARKRALWEALTDEFPRLVAQRGAGTTTARKPPTRKAAKKAAPSRKAAKKAGAPRRDGLRVAPARRPAGASGRSADVAFDIDDRKSAPRSTRGRPRKRSPEPSSSDNPAAVYLNAWFPDVGLGRALHRDHPTVMSVNLGPRVQVRGANSEAVSEAVRERLFALPEVEVAVECLDADVFPNSGRLGLPPPTDTLYFVVIPRKTGTLKLVVVLLARNAPVHRTTLAVKVSARPRARKDG